MPGADGRTILLVGSGPIQIGQAAEFDYSGAQACRALQEEGARVVLVNSNPATIMTDPEMADAVYVEPITPEAIAEVIRKEDPDGVIAGLGGQTGLNVTAALAEQGVLEAHDVEVMGTPLDTIYATENRELFRERMAALGQPVPRSETIESVDAVEDAVDAVGGLPVIVRTTYTLGGAGSGVVDDVAELKERTRKGLRLSRNGEVMVTESIDGWIELEYEVMRDHEDSCIIVCNMENVDPMGIHTGESIVVTPSQVIPDEGHQAMRSAAIEVIRELGIHGGCNIQFAWRPEEQSSSASRRESGDSRDDDGTPGGEYRVVEVNPRVSRSSALASKATGYPIARVTAKVALGKRLHEIDNEITGQTTAAFEPAIDYVVTKVPRWPKDKFPEVDFELSTAMKSTGEAMAIGRTFEESLLKALRSAEYEPAVDWAEVDDAELAADHLATPTPDRAFAVFEAFDRGWSVDRVADLTGIHEWYLQRYRNVAEAAAAVAGGTRAVADADGAATTADGSGGDRPDGAATDADGDLAVAAETGFTNSEVAALAGGGGGTGDGAGDVHGAAAAAALRADGGDPAVVDRVERAAADRAFKQVDTCAGEFAAATPYYYSARTPATGGRSRHELEGIGRDDAGDAAAGGATTPDPLADVERVVIVGGGPIRIGQGVEFDYCTVHAVRALRDMGVEAHVVNNNPETVSTDYDTSDGLFFEPVTAEEVADVVEATDADGAMVQFGGQTSVNVGAPLAAEFERRGLDCEILGTSVASMDLAEDRDRFNRLLSDLGVAQPEGGAAESEAEALALAREVGYPVLVRPSYVLGGRAMEVVRDDEELREYVGEAVRVSPDKPVLVDEFLEGAVELDVDAVADAAGGSEGSDDATDVLIGGVMEHVESAGVHSGDSACVVPPRSLDGATLARVREVVEELARALDAEGLVNVQLAVKDGEIYVIEANPRSSRTVPFISKATGVPIAKLAAKVMAGASLSELDVAEQVPEQYSVKEVVLPFDRLPGSDPRLGPEMKSTGEVMATAGSFGRAYGKAQSAANNGLPEEGVAVVDLDVDGFQDYYDTYSTDVMVSDGYDDLPAAIRAGSVGLLVSDAPDALRTAVEEGVPYLSTVAAAEAAVEALAARDEPLDVAPLSERPVEGRTWGPGDGGT